MRKLSSSQPISVTTQVSGLTVSLVLDPSGPMRQWLNHDTGEYSPDRETTSPLIIKARVDVIDNANNQTSTADLVGGSGTGTRWMMRTTSASGVVGSWEDITTSPPSGYETSKIWQARTNKESTIYVKKNIEAGIKIELRCIMQFCHPQMPGYTYTKEQILLLCTNEDSDVQNPKLWLNTPETWIYDVLLDNNTPGDDTYHIRTVSAYAEEGGEDVTSGVYFYWSIFENGIEYPVGVLTNHPCYVSGGLDGSSLLVVDAMYSEAITIKCKAKDRKLTPQEQEAAEFFAGELSTDIIWKPLEVSKQCVCKNGAAIQIGNYPYKIFSVDVSRKDRIFTKEEIMKNFLFEWKSRIETSIANEGNETFLGWGYEIQVVENVLAQSSPTQRNVNVFADVYLKGAYANVVQGSNNIVCTINGTKYNIISRS